MDIAGTARRALEAVIGRRTTAALAERVEIAESNVELYRSHATELQETLRELVPDEIGWQLLSSGQVDEFTAAERLRIRALCRLMAIKNPLIKRGLGLRYVYVHGRGVQIAARATGSGTDQDVNAVIQGFLDDPINAKVFGPGAAEVNERALGTDGDLYFALWTMPRTGAVRVRKIPCDEVTEVVTNPDDDAEVWYYRRCWTRSSLGTATGTQVVEQREAWYPDVTYTPTSRPRAIGGVPVVWDAPVVHLAVNSPDGWHFGIPDAFASVDWAMAYKTFLEDWARLMRSLSRFAWKTTAPGRQGAQVKARIAQPPATGPDGRPELAGATAVVPPTMQLEAVSKSGATLDSDSGRPLAAMVAAGLDIPVTMLLGDPGVTGARATAETLDEPMRLAMEARRDAWTWLYRVVCGYVVDQAVKAPQGRLRGMVSRNEYDRQVVTLAADTDRGIEVTWPDLDKTDPVSLVQAVAAANQTGTIPPLVIARLLLEALGVQDIDDILAELTDDQGEFAWPDGPPPDPGPMVPDPEPDDGTGDGGGGGGGDHPPDTPPAPGTADGGRPGG